MLVVTYSSTGYFIQAKGVEFKKNDWQNKSIISDFSGQIYIIAKHKNRTDSEMVKI